MNRRQPLTRIAGAATVAATPIRLPGPVRQSDHHRRALSGSHVNIVARLRNNNYQDNEGADVYALGFTAEEVDYLDSRAESEARRARDGGTPNGA